MGDHETALAEFGPSRPHIARVYELLIEPGLVLVSDWRPDPGDPSAQDYPVLRMACLGVARKP